MYNEILLLRIVLTPGVLIGPYDACDLIYSYYTIFHQGLSKVSRNKSRVVFEPPWWFSEKFYATVTSIKKKKLIFRPFSYLTFPFVTHAFLPLSIAPSPLVAILSRAEKRLWTKLHGRMDLRIFKLGNGTFTEDPRISRRNPSRPCLVTQRKKCPILFVPAHYKSSWRCAHS